ncbi:MAG: aminotransferase class III-fold pyridoxal phosphate-dependent enzyme [Shimia sp.]
MSDVLARRARLLGPQMTTFYREPVHLVRGKGVHVWDADGRQYLDCYNNVPHVGHCHPRVVEAIATQAATLNTHTRYVHDGILDYGEALTARFDHSLDSMVMVCSGSEANDVALRMAQAVTGKTGVITTDNTYHGNTAAVSQLNSAKVPIGGFQAHVQRAPAPDNLMPPSGTRAGQAAAFTEGVKQAISALEANGAGVSALIVCPYFANEGFPTVEAGFLDEAIALVHAAGGLVIADEVQPGFGRIGSHWWGHQKLAFAPDIVTLGKPMANGHPVAAAITRPEILACFQEGFKYFNTFGGNPVSAAAAMAVLNVIEDEALVSNAQEVGAYALNLLNEIQARFDVVADVRGSGLFFGAELWRDGAPATTLCDALVEEMRQRGVLLHTEGRFDNTLKIRPPCVFSRQDADRLIETLDTALGAVV